MIRDNSATRAMMFDVNVCDFDLTTDHLKLLQRMYVGWSDEEYGAPEIDPKRPYGNSSVEDDICEILGVEMIPDPDEADAWVFPDAEKHRAAQIHREMGFALQIVLMTQQFRPGRYRRTERYNRRSWVLVEAHA